MEERHLSLGEVAGLLSVSERTVRRWIKSGKLKAYKPGRDYRIPESAVRQFVEESEVYPKGLVPPSLFNGLREERRDPDPDELNAIEKLIAFCDQLESFLVNFLPENASTDKGKDLLNMQRFSAIVVAGTSLPWAKRESLRPLVIPVATRFVVLVRELEERAEEVGIEPDEETRTVIAADEHLTLAS